MTQHPRGQYLIEATLALGLFMLFVGVLSLLAIDTSSTARFQEQQLHGMIGLQNATEAIHSIAKNDWDNLTVGTHGLTLQSSQWTLQPVITNENDISKQITVSYARRNPQGQIDPLGTEDQHTKQVDIEVRRVSTNKLLFTQTLLFTQAMRQLQNWNETTTADFADGTFTSTIGTTLTDGEITLASGGQATMGFAFLLSLFNNTPRIADNNDRIAFRFTSPFSNPLTEIRAYVASKTGNSSVFRFGIQADNAGVPSGIFLTSGTFIASSTGWQTATLSTSYTPTAGTTYYVVGERVSGGGRITLRTTNPRQNIMPSSGHIDTQQQTLQTTNGTTWTTQNLQPVMLLQDAIGTTAGNTYTTSTNQAIWGTQEIGEVLRFAQATTITGATFAVSRTNTPAGNLELTIRDLTNNSVLATKTIATPGQVTTSTQWYAVTLDAPITFPVSHNIRLEIASPNSNQSNRRYNIPFYQSIGSSPYQETTFGGTNAYADLKTTTLWSADPTADMPFQLQTWQGYMANGTYQSSAFDTGNRLTLFGAISWTAQTPAGTSISFQTRTANTLPELASAVYVGSDGTSATSHTNGDPIAIDAGSTGTRFIQYRIIFTGTTLNAPQVEDVHITYE